MCNSSGPFTIQIIHVDNIVIPYCIGKFTPCRFRARGGCRDESFEELNTSRQSVYTFDFGKERGLAFEASPS